MRSMLVVLGVAALNGGSGAEGEHIADLVVQDGRVEGDLPFGTYLSSR